MLNIIFLILSSVALSTAQLDVGPQTFPEQTSSSPRIPYKQYNSNQGFKYIFAPIQFNDAQNIKSENQKLDQQQFVKQAFLPFINFSPSEEFQVQNREQKQVQPQTFIKNEKPVYKDLLGLRFFKFPAEQKPRKQYQIVNLPQVKQLQKESSPIAQYFNKEQLERNLIEEIRWKLNHMVENNQNNSKNLSTVSDENKFSKTAQTEQPTRTQTNNQDNEQRKDEVPKVKEILSGQGLNQNTDEAEEPNYEKSPFFIHRQVTVTKHHPVDIVKQVKVAVPTPVLVPIPEPYEVKVPHPYPVPIEVIRHIPVPVGRTH